MRKKERAAIVIERLKKEYPGADCTLDYNEAWKLLVSVRLAAQCTDERVNKTTPSIFSKYNTPQDFININIEDLEKLIHPCGFYKNKAKNIKAYAKQVLQDFNGVLPDDINKLVLLPGIGRKSANVIMLEAFNNPVRNCS